MDHLDAEARRILDDQGALATSVPRANAAAVQSLAQALISQETVDRTRQQGDAIMVE